MRVPAAGAVAVLAGYATLQVAGRTSGSTRMERRRELPGDELIAAPSLVTNHAATLDAPPEQVWPWLTQVGWHLGGWYTPRWVDQLLFPGNWPSAERLDPALVRDLHRGDTIPDGPPGTAHFVVETADAPRVLVLHSTTHLPPTWSDRFEANLDWIWTFALDPAAGGRTRMLIRNRGTLHPWWVNAGYLAAIVPADHLMATGMLRGLQARVTQPAGRPDAGLTTSAAT